MLDLLARSERFGSALNPFVLLDGERALAAARASEARWWRDDPAGAIDGVPVSIKDLLLTREWPTRRGSLTTSAAGPWDEDARAVARLRERGAVLFAKTTTSEFGLKGLGDSPLTGITRNPWDLSRSPAEAARVQQRRLPLASGRSQWRPTAGARSGCRAHSPV